MESKIIKHKKSILVINASERFPEINYENVIKYKYVIGNGENYDDEYISLNDNNKFNKLCRNIRDQYCDWVYSCNQSFIDEGMSLNDLSLFFFSDLADKRIKLFNTYQDICNLLMLDEIFLKHKFEAIYIFGVDKYFWKNDKTYQNNSNAATTSRCFSFESQQELRWSGQ